MKFAINLFLSAFLAAVPGAALLIMSGAAPLANPGLYEVFVLVWTLLVAALIYVRCAR